MPESDDKIVDISDPRFGIDPLDFLTKQHLRDPYGRSERQSGRPRKGEDKPEPTVAIGCRAEPWLVREVDVIINGNHHQRFQTRADWVNHWLILGAKADTLASKDPIAIARVERAMRAYDAHWYQVDILSQKKDLENWKSLVKEHTLDSDALRNFRRALVSFEQGAATLIIQKDARTLIAEIDGYLK